MYNNRINFYCPKDKFNKLIKQLSDLKKFFNYHKKYFNKAEKNQITDLFSFFSNYKDHEQFNKKFIENTINFLPKDFFLFKNINLDNNQITSIVKEDKINLVIAGAGSGKTTTILGKIKYLVEICHFNPAQILILSYSVKSVEDFNDRIKKYLEYDIKAKTIHGFSYSIAGQTLQQRHSVANENTRTEAFMECLNNDARFVHWWSEFIAYYWDQKITDIEVTLSYLTDTALMKAVKNDYKEIEQHLKSCSSYPKNIINSMEPPQPSTKLKQVTAFTNVIFFGYFHTND